MPFTWTNIFMAAPAAHVPLPTPVVTLPPVLRRIPAPANGTQKIRLIPLDMARSRDDIKYRKEGHEMRMGRKDYEANRKFVHCQLMGYVAGGPYSG